MIRPRYDVDWAIYKAGGRKPRFLFFWSHKSHSPDPTEAVLSQWYPAGFSHKGTRYPSAEHWMMAAKARLFGDAAAESRILASPDPGRAKALGRAVEGFDSVVWDKAAYGIVLQGTLLKFSKNKALGQFLRDTGRKILVEASPHDRIWGIGLRKDDPNARVPEKWRGRNLLGFALMEARDRLDDDQWPAFEEI